MKHLLIACLAILPLAAETPQTFTLKNKKGMEAVITNYGGILMSLKVPGRTGQIDDVVLGFDKAEDYITHKDHPYFGAIVGRYGNRIGGAKFSIDGKTYTLAANNGKNSLHGGIVGFDKKFWKATQQGNRLMLELISPDGDEGFPGELRVQVTYTLTDQNELRIDYRATTNRPTPVNLTNHSYFNLGGSQGKHIRGHILKLNASKFTPVDAGLIPTGEIQAVAGTPFDFTRPTPIGARIEAKDEQIRLGGGYDHNFVFDKGKTPTPQLVAEVLDTVTGRRMEVLTTEPGVQFYTSNGLSMTGKGGVHYERHSGFCLETQHFPDSPNKANFPSTILRPGDTYRSSTIFRFSVR